MKSYYIHFIRHGLTDATLEGRYIGHTDAPLSEDGIAQLTQMKENCIFPDVGVVFTSPLSRCTKTAKILYPDKNAIAIDGLIEYSFGEFENKTAQELKEHPVFPKWLAGEKGVDPPFGESNEDFSARICNTLSKIIEGMMKTSTLNATIITHGGIIMALLSAFGLPELPMHDWLTPNGCGYTVRITPSIWMNGKKFEVVCEIPKTENKNDDYSNDYYGEDIK